MVVYPPTESVFVILTMNFERKNGGDMILTVV